MEHLKYFLISFSYGKNVSLFIYLWEQVFCCLQTGRGRRSHAYTHSVQVDHHVFLNLHTLKVKFVLPSVCL